MLGKLTVAWLIQFPIENQEVEEISKPSIPKPRLSKWLIPAISDWAIIALCFAVAHWCLFQSPSWLVSLPALFVALLVLAGRQNALGLLGHDGAH